MIPKQDATLLPESGSNDNTGISHHLMKSPNYPANSHLSDEDDTPGALFKTIHMGNKLPSSPNLADAATTNPYASNLSLLPGGIDPQLHATVLKTQKLLLRLTKALFAYGAPLYRVEIRVQAVAETLNLPLSILTLPNAMVLAFGDGSPGIWPQTYIVKGYQGQNMGRLHVVDKWAKKIMAQCHMTKQALQLLPGHNTNSAAVKSAHLSPDLKSRPVDKSTAREQSESCLDDDQAEDSEAEQKLIFKDSSRTVDGHKVGNAIHRIKANLNKLKIPSSAHNPQQFQLGSLHPGTSVTILSPKIIAVFCYFATSAVVIFNQLTTYFSACTGGSNAKTDHDTTSSKSPPNLLLTSPVSADMPGTPNAPTPTAPKPSQKIALDKQSTYTSINTLEESIQPYKQFKHVLTMKDAELDWFLGELDRLVNSHGKEIPTIIRILSSGLTAMLLLLLLNPATIWDLVLTFILGTMNGALTHWGEVKKINALEVLVPMIVSMVGKVLEVGLRDQICFGTITMFACFSYFPGTLMALSMVELASRNLVSGTVRMFYSFVRSIKFGFGLAMGSRLIGWINSHGIPGVEMPKDNIHCMSSARPYTVDVYKNLGFQLLVFVPMSISINILLRSKKSQWPGMCFASVVGLLKRTANIEFNVAILALQLASNIFTKDASAALAAFSIGMVSHMLARYKDDLAIANILAGITWLTPGSVGVRGAALLMTDDLKGSTSFALDMIIRAMSVSIGLYVSGLILFPMVRKSKLSVLSL